MTTPPPSVMTYPADTDYEDIRRLWNSVRFANGPDQLQEVTVLELFSHPGAKHNAGVWLIGLTAEIRDYVDMHPKVCADYRDATSMIQQRIW